MNPNIKHQIIMEKNSIEPLTLEMLLKEDSTLSQVKIPESVNNLIIEYQDYYRRSHGEHLGKNTVITKIFALALPRFQNEIGILKQINELKKSV